MTDDPQCPHGYRFLVQLVDAKDAADARQTIEKMYGTECLLQSWFTKGAMRCKQLKGPWTPSPEGYRVYVPKGFRI